MNSTLTSEATRHALNALFSAISSGASPQALALHFSDAVDWFIPGDAEAAPWVGRKYGRAGVASFFTELHAHLRSESFALDHVFVDDEQAVAVGHLVSVVLRTGKTIDSAFAIVINVENGLITRYHLIEDSLAVYRATQSIN